jgi:hypothetical protein
VDAALQFALPRSPALRRAAGATGQGCVERRLADIQTGADLLAAGLPVLGTVPCHTLMRESIRLAPQVLRVWADSADADADACVAGVPALWAALAPLAVLASRPVIRYLPDGHAASGRGAGYDSFAGGPGWISLLLDGTVTRIDARPVLRRPRPLTYSPP